MRLHFYCDGYTDWKLSITARTFFLIPIGKWSSPPVTGTRPPPSMDFSLTMVTDHIAVLFGGVGSGQLYSHVYTLDLWEMVSSLICWLVFASLLGSPPKHLLSCMVFIFAIPKPTQQMLLTPKESYTPIGYCSGQPHSAKSFWGYPHWRSFWQSEMEQETVDHSLSIKLVVKRFHC